VEVRFAQLEESATATPYQKVTADYDITEAGVADKYGLLFDGVDDFMVTPSIDLSGTDEASLALALEMRKETIFQRPLSFNTTAPGVMEFYTQPGATQFAYLSGGTTAFATLGGDFSAPSTLIGRSKISTPISKFNTNIGATSRTDSQGTGNFISNDLNIGRRSNGTSYTAAFITNAFLIDRYITDEETTDLEATLASKAGVTLP
jgi:hypothetical protein